MNKKYLQTVFGLTTSLMMGYIGFNSIVFAEEVEEPVYTDTTTSETEQASQPLTLEQAQPTFVEEQEPVLSVAEDTTTVPNVTYFVDEAGNTIAPQQSGHVAAIAINGYVHKGTRTRTDSRGNVETTYIYRLATPDDAPVQNVTHFVDEAGNTLSADQQGSVQAIGIVGYAHKQTKTRSDDNGNVETTHIYKVAEAGEGAVENVTRFVDEAGNELAPVQAGKVNPISIEGYYHASTRSNKDAYGNVETIYTYKSTDDVTVENVTLFVDENGNTIAPKENGEVEAKYIEGYVALKTTYRKDDFGHKETTHIYRVATEADELAQNVTHFVDVDGNTISADQDGKVDAIDIEGYVYTKTNTFKDGYGNVETTHVYRVATQADAPINNVTHFVSEAGDTLSADQNGEVEPITIEGYLYIKSTLRYDDKGNKEVTHIYRVNDTDPQPGTDSGSDSGSTTDSGSGTEGGTNTDPQPGTSEGSDTNTVENITMFVDEQGNELAPKENGTVAAKTIDGYVYKGRSVRQDSQGNVETTYIYRVATPDDAPVRNVTHFVDEAGNPLADDVTGNVSAKSIVGYTHKQTKTRRDDNGNVETTHVYALATETPATIQNLTHFVDEAGNKIADDQSGKVDPISIEGYVNVSTRTARDDNGNEETTHVYRAQTQEEVVNNVTHFVDQLGNTISPDQFGMVDPIEIAGYVVVSTKSKLDDQGNVETTHVYRVKTQEDEPVRNVTHFVDDQGVTLAQDKQGKVDATAIAGYVYVKSTIAKDDKGNVETTHIYRKKTADEIVNNVTHFVDEEGNSIAADQSGTVDPIDITGYQVISSKSKSDGQENVETTHIYQKVTTNTNPGQTNPTDDPNTGSGVTTVENATFFVDEAGKTIAAKENGTVAAKTISGYVYKGKRVREDSQGNLETTHIYRVATEADRPVENKTHYVDESGTKLVADKNGQQSAIQITGYKHIRTATRSDEEGNKEFTHIYAKLTAEETVENKTHFVDEAGIKIAEDVNGNVAAKTISGYVHKESVTKTGADGRKEITHVYRVETEADRPVANVTHFVDTDGNTLSADQNGAVSPITISGYEVLETKTKSDDKGNRETTHIYVKVKWVTKFVDENGKSIASNVDGKVDSKAISGYDRIKSESKGKDGNYEWIHTYKKSNSTPASTVKNVTHFVDVNGKTLLADKNGVAKAPFINGYLHYETNTKKDGKGNVETTHVYKVETRTGFVIIDGNTYYLGKNGKIDTNYTKAVTLASDGKIHYFKNGVMVNNVTGLVKHADGRNVFVKNGVGFNYTGVVKSVADNKWYFVRKGVAEKFTGISKSIENGKWYFTRNGVLDWNFTGVAKSVENGQWYHCNKGALDWNFTGVSKSVENGKWYFSRKGKLDWSFTGLAKSVENGKWYFVRKGALDWSYTGGAKSVENGKWYAVSKGALNWNFTGKLSCLDGKIRTFKKGAAV